MKLRRSPHPALAAIAATLRRGGKQATPLALAELARMNILGEIEKLNPIRDHQRIVQLSACYDFPFDTTRALELALLRTYCVPTISVLLASTGEFTERAQKRYDDTDLLISEFFENGHTSPNGLRAIRRMNQIHARFQISNCDFLYVLSTFVFEPIRWNRRFGWRLMSATEKEAYFQFWRCVGLKMNIRAIPETAANFEAFNVEYEARNFRYSPSNQRVGEATREMFVRWFPWLPGALVRQAIYALMDEPLRRAFGFPFPWPGMPGLVSSALRLRGWTAGLLPTRARPRRRGDIPRQDYPRGYVIEELGPPPASSPIRT